MLLAATVYAVLTESLGFDENQVLQDLLVAVMSLSVLRKKTLVGKIGS